MRCSTKSLWFWYYSYFAEILLAVVADVMDGNDYLCESLKQFFSHAEKLTYRAMELSSQRKTPDEIMKIIQKEVKELV